ncbi:MAG: GC-type dockerin domain-anchored protein [Phycisphaerales bacterium]
MTNRKNVTIAAMVAACGMVVGVNSAQAQVVGNRWVDPPTLPTPPSHEEALSIDSGQVEAPADSDGPQIVFATFVESQGAPWLRLAFESLALAGDPANENAARLKITSMADGAVQWLNAETASQWRLTSAFMNGDTLLVELFASPNTGPSRIVMTRVTVGEVGVDQRSICGNTDDRQLSYDDRNARHSVGCSSWIINDLNSMFLTAGHCGTTTGHVMEFKVPLSTASGSLVHPGPEHQYVVEATSVQGVNGGVGNDWGYFGVSANSNTGLTPFQSYGLRHVLGNAGAPSGHTIRITGYGTVSSPVSPTWNQVQKTHTGLYTALSGTNVQYAVDTTGGNSGSCVLNGTTGFAIGIHTHAGCSSSGGANNGTAMQLASLQTALANPTGICKSGKGTPTGNLYAAGDLANNFGTLNASTGNFAKRGELAAQFQGLTSDWNLGVLYAIDTNRKLYSINPSTAVVTLKGTVTGTSLTINGLGYNPRTGTMYAYSAGTGQLMTINMSTLVATNIGSAQGGNMGGIEWDTTSEQLVGVNDVSGGTRLYRINTTTGAVTSIGLLGSGITDCNGLAYRADDNSYYTINAANEQLLRINKTTGVATVVGATGGLFGAQYGLAALNTRPPCPPDLNHDGFVNGDDYDLFADAFESGGTAADYNSDGFVNGDDFDAFAEDFEAGC